MLAAELIRTGRGWGKGMLMVRMGEGNRSELAVGAEFGTEFGEIRCGLSWSEESLGS